MHAQARAHLEERVTGIDLCRCALKVASCDEEIDLGQPQAGVVRTQARGLGILGNRTPIVMHGCMSSCNALEYGSGEASKLHCISIHCQRSLGFLHCRDQ